MRSAVDLARSARCFDLLLLALCSFLVLFGIWSAQPRLRSQVRSGGPGLRYEGAEAPGAGFSSHCMLVVWDGRDGGAGERARDASFPRVVLSSLVMGTIQINTCCLPSVVADEPAIMMGAPPNPAGGAFP